MLTCTVWQEEGEPAEEIPYASPSLPRDSYFAEHFDDPAAFEKRWVRSKAKKDGADEDIAKYDGTYKKSGQPVCFSLTSVPNRNNQLQDCG